MSAPGTVTGPADLDPCPYRGGISGVKVITGTLPKVPGWSCSGCGTDWWISVVSPRPFLDHLTGTVELTSTRSVLREVIELAEQAPALTDEQLRSRLVTLGRTVRGSR
ncbi:MAG TPA: hypothetical protein VFO16_06520 [Pseudonocardiaceae bacterium]|nr:hypothetical protein [Pseudonocardiaceae bacterium]